MRNIATRTKPEGGALAGIVEIFIASAKAEAKSNNQDTEAILRQKLEQLTELVNGYDFADVIAAYWRGRSDEHTSELQSLLRISYPVLRLNTQTIKTKQENKITKIR